jgi:hypothetical protein
MKGVGEEPPEELMAALDPFSWLFPSGVTIGPVAAPAKLEPAEFLKGVVNTVGIATQQGWILSPSLAKEFQDTLSRAVDLLSKSDSSAARSSLEGLLKRVEEEKDKALLSESYALLKFNVEFLLQQMSH